MRAVVDMGLRRAMLPNLSSLQLVAAPVSVRARWLRACGTRPVLAKWKNMRGKHKYRLLHAVANRADDDEEFDGDYVSAYEQVDIDELFANRGWSVEHVVPRSRVRGSEAAESDPVGWVEAVPRANSRRSNHPLVLWPADFVENALVEIDGQLHYVPPLEQRARLARKWLFVRATYDDIDPPSRAQKRARAEILAMARDGKVWPAERRVNDIYRRTLGWANPLLETERDFWYNSEEWASLIF